MRKGAPGIAVSRGRRQQHAGGGASSGGDLPRVASAVHRGAPCKRAQSKQTNALPLTAICHWSLTATAFGGGRMGPFPTQTRRFWLVGGHSRPIAVMKPNSEIEANLDRDLWAIRSGSVTLILG